MSRKRERSYFSWLSTAEQLLIPYDHFDFAEKNVGKKQRDINRWYYNTLYKALLDVEGANRLNVLTAFNKFENRNDSRTAFGEEYKNYWLNREKSDSQQRIETRQRTASEVANEAACSAFEGIILKIASKATTATSDIGSADYVGENNGENNGGNTNTAD